MHDPFISLYDLIQIGLTLLALYCVYIRGYHTGIDAAFDYLDYDPEQDEEIG